MALNGQYSNTVCYQGKENNAAPVFNTFEDDWGTIAKCASVFLPVYYLTLLTMKARKK